jgi:uncharacterized protein (TIGR02594 family)
MEPEWLQVARKYVGVREIPGKGTEPLIAGWLKRLGGWWNDDATPWCGTFVGNCLLECDIPVARHWYRARDWLNWGMPLVLPTLGAVVVYERTGGGHVGFLVGVDREGNLMTLGGNQGDKVSIAPFSRERVLGFRWPPVMIPPMRGLPLLDSDGRASLNES